MKTAMKKKYISPVLVCLMMSGRESLMTASGVLPTQVFDDETASGDESLSRRQPHSVWDDEDSEEEEEY